MAEKAPPELSALSHALRESEAKFRAVVDSSNDGILFCDVNAVILYRSPSNTRINGYADAERVGKLVFDVVHPADLNAFHDGWQKAIHYQNAPVKLVHRAIHKNGTILYIDSTIQNLLENRNIHAIIVIMRDITERRQAEEALRESEERFRSLSSIATEGIMVHVGGVVLDANRAFSRLAGYDEPEQIIGKNGLEIIPFTQESLQRVRMHMHTGSTETYDIELIAPDGRIIPAETDGNVITYRGRPARIVRMRDITERKKAEETLIESEQKFRQLANSVPVGIFEVDDKGNLTFANTTLFEWFGYTEEEFKAGINILDLADPGDRERLRENMAQVVSLQPSPPREYCLVRKNGEKIQTLALTKPILTQGRLLGFRGILLDLTEKKKVEFALQNAVKLESLGVFAGGIAHDFNNLLTGIYGYMDLARSVSKDVQINEYLDAMFATLKRAKALTLQLLTFSKGGSPVKKITNLVPFIQETAQFVLSGSNISCHFSLDENLRQCIIDKNQIAQVIDNIVINAQQAMPGGGTIHITAQNVFLDEKGHSTLSKGAYVKISIKDFGIGIPKEIMPHIFDPFYTTKIKGHGLGLATCYSIIKRHDGCIDVESEPGKGSVFHVYLPATSETVPSNASLVGSHKGRGTIVVVDDEETVRNVFRQTLEKLGYTVVCTNEGKAAVDFFSTEIKENRKCAAMIFDLTIPGGLGGIEAVEEIRKLNANIPVFVASGYADNYVMKHPGEYGFTASISKPFTIEELAKILNKHLKE